MDISTVSDWIALALTVIGGLSIVVKGVAVITDVTPGTRDDEIVSQGQVIIQKIQRVLGALSLDMSKQQAKK